MHISRIDIIFSRWEVASKVHKLIHWFQKTPLRCPTPEAGRKNPVCQRPGSIVQSWNYWYLSVRVAFIDEMKMQSSKVYHDSLKYIYIYIYIYHHHVVLVARISLTLSRHSSLSFIASGRSSGQHPVSSHSCWMYVRAGRPAFARPCVGVHKSTSLMSSSLLLQQCPARLVRLTWIVFVIGGRWPYSWCLVGCCRQDLFKIARSILV